MSVTNIAFTVPGEPQGKGRARAGRGPGGQARLYTPAKTVAYESLVAMSAKAAMGGASPFSGPVALELEAIHTVPASWSNKRRQQALDGQIIPTCKPDLDNVLKAIGDGANGIAWVDDKQIAAVQMVKRYGPAPGVLVRVADVDGIRSAAP